MRCWRGEPRIVITWRGRLAVFTLLDCVARVGHQVIDTGPCSFVRHPIYSSLTLAALKTAIDKGTFSALLGVAALAFAFCTRARRAKRFLRAELGEGADDTCARKTAMLFPFTRRPAGQDTARLYNPAVVPEAFASKSS